MYPYQLSKTLADQRMQEIVTRSERNRWSSERQPVRADRADLSSRLSDAKARVLGVLQVRVADRAASRESTTSAAGPMGCVA